MLISSVLASVAETMVYSELYIIGRQDFPSYNDFVIVNDNSLLLVC
jgi:hypothetical protein